MSERGYSRSFQEQQQRSSYRPGYPSDRPAAYEGHCWDCNRLGHYANSQECYVRRIRESLRNYYEREIDRVEASRRAVIFNIDNNSTLQTRPTAQMRFPASSRDRSRSPLRTDSNLRSRSPLRAYSSPRLAHNSYNSGGWNSGSHHSDQAWHPPPSWGDYSHSTSDRGVANEHRTSSDTRRDQRNGQHSQPTNSAAGPTSAGPSSVDDWAYDEGVDWSTGGNESNGL